ncbi:MAG TPA: thiamine pyrophosphate-binding protein [Ktedonobacteraceae bacterium]|nr:thiamine pyrophosphate-binding protein [Ktedonobacteraceae bacterium]
MSETVIEHVLGRLKSIGIDHIFGVPGDYAFPVEDAIMNFRGIEWVGCCNELNAAYAADGYARIHGLAAVNTTYGVGELSAINAIAGAYAEHLPVFHLVGMPNMTIQAGRALVHHTLGNGEFDLFRKMAEPAVCASAIMTPQNVAYETERLIAEALYHRRPVYMSFPGDVADQMVVSSARSLDPPISDPKILQSVTDAIVAALQGAHTTCVLPGVLVVRAGLRDALQSFVDACGLPFATMLMDKSVLEEQHPSFIGMYDGKLMDESVRAFVESSDLVLNIGAMMTDMSTGGFTAHLDPEKTINISHHLTQVGSKVYPNVEMKDVLTELTRRVKKRIEKSPIKPVSLGAKVGSGSDPITVEALYPRWANFLKPNDILVVDTGTSALGLAFALLPTGVTFHSQTLWGSIGWATPAAFGAAVAATDRRVVLVTGDGSHQLTAQEISQFGRRGLKPIVFVLNNSGYLIERLLCRNPAIEYNDLAPWRYSEIPHALGCDGWFTTRVTTCGEFDQALKAAEQEGTAAYIEVVTDTYAAPPIAKKMHESLY